jgi:hypothetical protein
MGWYLAWRRLSPDAVRLARRRRSRAARKALKALGSGELPMGEDRVRHVGAVVVRYLQDRLELETKEPTPAEIAAHLCRSGLNSHLVERARFFFEACDAVRYGLLSPFPHVWADEAKQLILALEAATWGS